MSESKELTAQEQFEQKMYERLRADIGELLPDEVLAEMAERALEKMFFKTRVVQDDDWRQTRHELPSWFEERVEKLLRERMDAFAKQWMETNADFLADLFTGTMTSVMPAIVASAVFKPIDNAINRSEMNMHEMITNYMQQQFPNAAPMT